jgi:hypothetical protein
MGLGRFDTARGLFDDEERNREGMPNALDGLPVNEIADPTVAMGAHDDEVNPIELGGADDFVGRPIRVKD